ncbi:MAG TPA: adenine phosphoribosyltransferase [Bacteroidetes bacterium]|nr:adenine phosphoribosyltransferase [Bacteroidota bacterium]
MDLKAKIRNVPDFPKPGIGFKDITTLLKDRQAFHEAIDRLAAHFAGRDIDVVVGIESRGFLLGGALAYKWKIGLVPVRKPGKLPAATFSETYELEYGTDTLEIHKDAIQPGQKVLLIDDLLATGGTLKAAAGLVEKCGGRVIGIGCLIELTFLNGLEKLQNYDFYSLIQFDSE